MFNFIKKIIIKKRIKKLIEEQKRIEELIEKSDYLYFIKKGGDKHEDQ